MSFTSISIDLGATSGRVVLARLDNGRLELEEVHRFANGFSTIAGRTYCNLYYLFDEIRKGLKKVGSRDIEVSSIGIDTWGVDIVCIGKDGHILSQPRAYRDHYTDGMMEEYFKIVPKDEVYRRTGIQFMNFNTLFQLFTLRREGNSSLEAADKVLFLPDALSYLLTGKMVCEYTILSTSQFLNPYDKKIDAGLLEAAGISCDLFPEIVMPGHIVGTLTDDLAKETGLGKVKVVAVAGHDTGSAVAAVPATTTGATKATSTHDAEAKLPMVQKMILSILSWCSTIKNEMTAEIRNVRHTPVSSSVVACMRLPMEAIR